MVKPFELGEYTITPQPLEKEVNYIVSNKDGYTCRLVPGYAGFEISKADKALGIELPLEILSQISDLIVTQDA